MKIFNIFILFLKIININSFKNLLCSKIKTHNLVNNIEKKNNIILYCESNKINLKKNIIHYYELNKNKIKFKFKNYLQLIRSNNILPTFLLSFTGGWIMNPSIVNLFYSKTFIISIINTILIMSSSMILNDIYDIEIDKINNSNRPLVIGSIKIIDAFLFTLLLLGITEYLTLQFMNDNLKFIIQLIIIQIVIYTPILKRITFIKNISCASLVSFSLFFSGLASSSNIMVLSNKNFDLLSIAMSFIFYGSLSNELLLDIRDIEGDKNNNIITIPVIFGKKITWIFTNIIVFYNIISNALSLEYLYNNQMFSFFTIIILSPLLYNLRNIKQNNYSKKSIVEYMNKSNYPFIFLLFYICNIAYLL
jgi:geranylgeranylglycerol-phosphate geranylgeranyltransferase